MARILRNPVTWIILVAFLAAIGVPWFVSAYILGVLTTAYYFGVFAMSDVYKRQATNTRFTAG